MFNAIVVFFSQEMFGLPLWLLAIINIGMTTSISFIILGVLRLVSERR